MKPFAPLFVVAALFGVALLTNPNADRHREKIASAISERSQVQRLLGIGHLTSFVSTYHSLAVASYTTVDDKVTSWGAFGMVFVTD